MPSASVSLRRAAIYPAGGSSRYYAARVRGPTPSGKSSTMLNHLDFATMFMVPIMKPSITSGINFEMNTSS